MGSAIKYKRLIGIGLAILLTGNCIETVLSSGGRGMGLIARLFLLLASSLLMTAFFIANEKAHRILLAVSFFTYAFACVLSVALSSYASILSYLFWATVFIAAGILLLIGENTRKACLILLFASTVIVLFFKNLYTGLSDYFYLYSWNLNLYYALRPFAVISESELAAVMADLAFLMPRKKAPAVQEIALDPRVITFRDMLTFIEQEHAAGRLTEEEYQAKRNYILSKL